MNLLLTLFRIVINWACKLLVKICKRILKEVMENLSEDIAKKVVSKLLRNDRNYTKRVHSLKK
jgi:hypothetical protein